MENFISTPFVLQDFYKLSHVMFYKNVTGTYATCVNRVSRRAGIDKMVVFGIQAFVKNVNDYFNTKFFNLPEDEAVERFVFFNNKTGNVVNEKFVNKVRELHRLSYLPIRIKALKEGSAVNYNTPFLTIQSTDENSFWVAQWIETWLSNETWRACTSATTAFYYRKILNRHNAKTSDLDWIKDWQTHDFSARGMAGWFDASISGAAHCLSSLGSDTCSVVDFVDYYYSGDNGLILSSVPASEHSIQQTYLDPNTNDVFESDCIYTQNTIDTFPTGIVSQVSDGYDYYGFLENVLPRFKDAIMARDGKFVIRPDSSPKTPYEIIVGDPDAPEGSIEHKGSIEWLYELFGGTINSKGYKVLDPHVGLIYGDAISLIIWDKILTGLEDKGFSSDNIVVGVGSASYTGYGGGLYPVENPQPYGISRDTCGLAIKETAVASGFGEEQVWRPTYKDPKTDNSGKKSHRGFIMIEQNGTEFIVHQNATREQEGQGALELVYENGKIHRHQSFADVRAELAKFF
jgi:nicotinamide phosphoribosyltransferase